MNFRPVLALVIVLVLMVPATAPAKDSLLVFVSILPQKYFVQRIAGENARVEVMVTPGKSPETYSPSPHQIKQLATASLYFTIGVPFENGIVPKIKALSPGMDIVDTLEGVEFRHLNSGESPGHQDHGHIGKDPHTWMSPLLVKIQARTMTKALIRIDPENQKMYEQNFAALARDLEGLHLRLKEMLAPFTGETLFVFHPVFGYFTDLYGLKQKAVETMGKSPKGKELSAIIRLAKSEKARAIFVQPQFDQNAATKIAAAINGTLVSIDPLALDYLANMEALAHAIVAAFTP